jgi:hypothetical protein
MKFSFKHKIFIFFILLLSIVAILMTTTNSNAQKNLTSLDNIVVIKKYKYYDSDLASKHFQAFQKVCTMVKEAGYKQSGQAVYAPRDGEYLTIDEIRKLDDITVTEYFRGTDYARHEEGQTWHPSFLTTEQKNAPETTFDCRLLPKRVSKIEIHTTNENILVDNLANNEQGLVTINSVPKSIRGYKLKNVPANLVAEKLFNSNFECLSSPALLPCYFKDLPIHIGTNREVVLQSKIPEKGLNPMWDASSNLPVPVLDVIEKGVYKSGDIVKIYENISIHVGKEISNNKFEIPNFAKNYKLLRK